MSGRIFVRSWARRRFVTSSRSARPEEAVRRALSTSQSFTRDSLGNAISTSCTILIVSINGRLPVLSKHGGRGWLMWIITARQGSYEKLMFSGACVILFTGVGGYASMGKGCVDNMGPCMAGQGICMTGQEACMPGWGHVWLGMGIHSWARRACVAVASRQ